MRTNLKSKNIHADLITKAKRALALYNGENPQNDVESELSMIFELAQTHEMSCDPVLKQWGKNIAGRAFMTFVFNPRIERAFHEMLHRLQAINE